MAQKVVVIDVGHGFYDAHGDAKDFLDSGAVVLSGGQQIQEFHLNMVSAIACQTALMTRGHHAVFIPFGLTLEGRGASARNADVFLAIHHNASKEHGAQGSEVCVQSWTATQADLALGRRVSKSVAESLGIPDRGIVSLDLGVLRAARKTNVKAAILTEAFFMDSAGLAGWSMARQSGMAIAEELDRWFKEGN